MSILPALPAPAAATTHCWNMRETVQQTLRPGATRMDRHAENVVVLAGSSAVHRTD